MKTYWVVLEGPTGIEKEMTILARNKREAKKIVAREYPRHTIVTIEV